MITMTNCTSSTDGHILELAGKSTDTKPTETFNGFTIGNGSTFTEMNTTKVFMFDGEAHEWLEL